MKVTVAIDGRWSGGGSVMVRNLHMAAALYPDVFTFDPHEPSIPLVPRNVPAGGLLRSRPYLLAPQNALPWASVTGTAGDVWLAARLRVASDVALRVAKGVLRISAAIPRRLAAGPVSAVLHNVLDEGFEHAWTAGAVPAAEPLMPDAGGSLLTVGSLQSYRNLPRLIAAHQVYRREGGRLPLLIAGPPGPPGALRRIKAAAFDREGVTLVARPLPRPAVIRAMRQADAVILPSLVEASPLTLLEAVAVNSRVAASDLAANRDILAAVDTAADECFFEPRSTASLAAAMHRLEGGTGMLALHRRLACPDLRAHQRRRWAEEAAEQLTWILGASDAGQALA